MGWYQSSILYSLDIRPSDQIYRIAIPRTSFIPFSTIRFPISNVKAASKHSEPRPYATRNLSQSRDDESIQQVECCKVPAFADHAARIEWRRERVLPTRQTGASGCGPNAEREVGG
ncbi:hypothetical protein MTR_2g426100 [Medicago truncatula]|uniref:Uncharacterized protein n=1 Tax=Medicago truncatula TaxID=3880 RepID=A0A072VFN0_MEDTR|nr:hypothetical protein MTR_2g426100 [Medicago truncatula]